MNEDIQTAKNIIEYYFPRITFQYMYTNHILVGLGTGEDVTIEVVCQTTKTSVILSFEKDGKKHSTNIQYAAENHLENSLKDSVKLLENRFFFVKTMLSSCLK